MKQALLTGLLCCCTVFAGYAARVAEDELRDPGEIQFEEFTGEYTRILSQEEIRGIGQQLAAAVTAPNQRFTHDGRYSIIHAVDPSVEDLYDADIFILEPASNIVNIRAIRTIIGAYIESRYGYSQQDAFMLATFVTYYNAVHRGNVNFFAERYKPVVTQNLTAASAGMATSYTQWPGMTRVVIPLTGAVDTSELTDSSVIDRLRTEDDKGIPLREHMVEFKEREIERLRDEVQRQEEVIREREEALIDRETELERDKDRIAEREREIQRLREEAEKISDPAERERELERIRKLEDELEKDRQAIVDRDRQMQEDRAQVDRDRQQLDSDRDRIVEREEEVDRDRDAIFEDKDPRQIRDELQRKEQALAEKEQELARREEELRLQQPDPRVFDGAFYYLKLKRYISDGHYSNELYLIDPGSREVLQKSPWENIAGRQYTVFEDGVVVIGYERAVRGRYFLVLLDREDLTLLRKGQHDIYWRSFVSVQDDHIYAVYEADGKFFMGRFNADLELTASSEQEVDEDTFVLFFENTVYLNSSEDSILVLDKNTLEQIDSILP